MSRSLLVALTFVLAASSSACKPPEGCEGAQCGSCEDGSDPIPEDMISPVKYGVDSAGVPVVGLVYNPGAMCFGVLEEHLWLRWKDGDVHVGPAEGAFDTSKAKLVYLSDLHLRAIRWSGLDLTMPFDETAGAFTFSVIQGKKLIGAYRCATVKGELACGPAP